MGLQKESSRRGFLSQVMSAPFVVAVVILGIAAVASHVIPSWLRLYMDKETLPLKAPLGTLDVTRMGPYMVVERHVLPDAMVETLGTTQYLSWTLEDTELGAKDPLHRGLLHVAYYSGRKLPIHRAGVCYVASGFTASESEATVTVSVPALGAASKLPVRVASFTKSSASGPTSTTVVYTYHCNGQFTASEAAVRYETSRIGNVYAYFAKIEITFPGAGREESIEGARKMYGHVLPELLRSHLPDFAAAEAAYLKKDQ